MGLRGWALGGWGREHSVGPQVARGGAPATQAEAGAHTAGGSGRRRAGKGSELGKELRQKVKAATKRKSQTVQSSQWLRYSTLGREAWGSARHK